MTSNRIYVYISKDTSLHRKASEEDEDGEESEEGEEKVATATLGQYICAHLKESCPELQSATVTCIHAGEGNDWCKAHKPTFNRMINLVNNGLELNSKATVIQSMKALFARNDIVSIVAEQGVHVLAFISYSTEDHQDDLVPCLYTHQLHVLKELDGVQYVVESWHWPCSHERCRGGCQCVPTSISWTHCVQKQYQSKEAVHFHWVPLPVR